GVRTASVEPPDQVLADASQIPGIVAEGGVEVGPHAGGEELLGRKAVTELVDLGASLEWNAGGRISGAIGHGIRRREREGRVNGGISFGQERRERDGIDEWGCGRTAARLAFARIASSVGPRAEATLVNEVTGARDEPHLEQLAPAEPGLDDLLTVFPRNLGEPAGPKTPQCRLAFTRRRNPGRAVPRSDQGRSMSGQRHDRP